MAGILLTREGFYRELPIVETERLLLRRLTIDDVDAVYTCCSDPEGARFMRWEPHPSRDYSRTVVEEILEQYRRGRVGPWGIEHKSDVAVIGTVLVGWPAGEQRSADLGYAISRAYWNRGLMTEALRGIARFAFTATELERLQAACEPENVGSWRALEKAGFGYECTMGQAQYYKGRHHTLRLYTVLRRDWLDRYGPAG